MTGIAVADPFVPSPQIEVADGMIAERTAATFA